MKTPIKVEAPYDIYTRTAPVAPAGVFCDTAVMRSRSVIVLATAAVFAMALPAVRAQEQNEPPPPANLYTLHVYTNLMQFPTIVLEPDLSPMKPIPREKFNLTLDGGPVFHPTKMRMEGDDPISLAVLLDVGGDQSGVLHAFEQSFPQLIPGVLHPHDRISIYSVDCTVMRTLKEAPAVDQALIAKGIANALVAPGLHGTKTKPACGSRLHLWDAMAMVAQQLGDTPSRRVLLVVSLGRENGSKNSLAWTAEYLSSLGVAVFGLRDNPEYGREASYSNFGSASGRRGGNNLPGILGMAYDEDLFSAMCGRNGGMILDASQPGVAKNLQHLIELLRGRYIIEYPRPDGEQGGVHSIDIKIAGTQAFIRPTGGSSPIPDPAIAADPSTLPSTPSPARIGNRRHLPQS